LPDGRIFGQAPKTISWQGKIGSRKMADFVKKKEAEKSFVSI
jgi:hypothetical protein